MTRKQFCRRILSELQTGMIRCHIVEENEAMLACFIGGLNRDSDDSRV